MDSCLKIIYLGFILNAVLVAAEFKFQKSLERSGKVYECPYPGGVFASPFDCRWFYTCIDSEPLLNRCPKPLYFDDLKKSCVCRSKDLKCGPIADITVAPSVPDPDASPNCVQDLCKLPNCFCSSDGMRIPGNMNPMDAPQMIILTFTGPLNSFSGWFFKSLFDGSHINPNGCGIKATFFVPHEYTSYYYVQSFHSEGHEIALQTIRNQQPEDFWKNATTEQWAEEVIGLREMIHVFSNVSRLDLVGMRAPFLQSGGNDMFRMILDFGLDYDSSLEAPLSDVPMWPYTLDYRIPHKCLTANCPRKSFPGIWEFPLNILGTDDISDAPCTFVDDCISHGNKDVIYDFFQSSFTRHYNSNRAPLLLNFHSDWLLHEPKMDALRSFIENVLRYHKDVWFVTMQQALEWMRHPVPFKFIPVFVPWGCSYKRRSICDIPNRCFYNLSDGNVTYKRYMELCGACPRRYPGVHNIKDLQD